MFGGSNQQPIRALLIAFFLFVSAGRAAAVPSLVWDPSAQSGVAGYVVSYGFTSGVYTQNIDVGKVTSWPIQQWTPGARYYFAVKAYNAAGTMSAPSNEVVWVAPNTRPNPRQGGPVGGGDTPPSEPSPGDTPAPGSANYAPPKVTAFATTAGARVEAGTRVRLAARAAGGIEPLQYRFWVAEPGQPWRILQDYGAGRTVDFRPAVPGRYQFLVWVRSAGSTETFEESRRATFVATKTDLRVDVVADRSLPAAPKVPIRFTATAIGTADPVEYRFWAWESASQQWTALGDYSQSRSATWTPTEAGRHQIQVWVRRVGSDAKFEAAAASSAIDISRSAARLLSLSANQLFPLPARSPVTLTAAAAGGTAALEYQFWRFDERLGLWSIAQPYGPSNTLIWTPGEQDWGRYAFRVWVRSAGSRARYEGSLGTRPMEIVP